MRRWLALVLPLALAACQPAPQGEAAAPPAAEAPPPAAAKATKVVVYSPHGREMLEPFRQRFQAAHPELQMEFLELGSQEILDRLRLEQANPGCDVWWGAPHDMFAKAAAAGLLQPYQPTWSEHLPAERRSPEHLWYGQYLTPGCIMYNSEALNAETAPQDWDDLLKPEWQDKILIRDPGSSGTMRTFLAAMILRQKTVEEGFAWLAKLDANTKAYPANPALLHRQINTQEGVVSVWNARDVEIQKREHGYKLGYLLPRSGVPVVLDAIALVKGAPHLEAAKTFYEFVTAPEQMIWSAEQFYTLPARTDIPADKLPAGLPRDIPEMKLDWAQIEQHGNEWMERWERFVKNRGAGGR